MSDPLIESRAVVGEWDPDADGWSARDWVPGPAGTVGLTLPGGVELEVDVASPATFVGLWVDAAAHGRPSAEAIETVATLLGRPRAAELFDLPAGGPRQLVPSDELLSRRRSFRGTDPIEPGVDASLARHALALDVATELGVSPLVQALALLDVATAAAEVRALGLAPRVRDAATQAVTILVDLGSDVGSVPPWQLAEALRRVEDFVDDRALRRRLRRLIDDLTEDRGVAVRSAAFDGAAPMAAPASASRAAGVARERAPVAPLLDVDVRSLSKTYRVADVAARATTPSEAEIRLPGRTDLAGRLWARAHAADGVPLAASRFVEVAGDAVARLLVPPASLPSAALDLTDRPGDPLPPSRIRTVADAIDHGRSAARAERLSDPKKSLVRWDRSARQWRTAGDDDRAETATRYGDPSDRDRGRVPAPLLSDGAVEAGA